MTRQAAMHPPHDRPPWTYMFRALPYVTALLLGVVAGFIADSPVVAGLVAAVTIAILVRL
jgi:hypothetical protein